MRAMISKNLSLHRLTCLAPSLIVIDINLQDGDLVVMDQSYPRARSGFGVIRQILDSTKESHDPALAGEQ